MRSGASSNGMCHSRLILAYRLTQNKRIEWLPRLRSRKRDSRHRAPRCKQPRIAHTRYAMDMHTDTRTRTGTSRPVTRPHRTRPRPMLPLLPHILNRPAPTSTFPLPLLRALSFTLLYDVSCRRTESPYVTPSSTGRSDNMYLSCILFLPYLPCSFFGLVCSPRTKAPTCEMDVSLTRVVYFVLIHREFEVNYR